jgi:hypothetical protein
MKTALSAWEVVLASVVGFVGLELASERPTLAASKMYLLIYLHIIRKQTVGEVTPITYHLCEMRRHMQPQLRKESWGLGPLGESAGCIEA